MHRGAINAPAHQAPAHAGWTPMREWHDEEKTFDASSSTMAQEMRLPPEKLAHQPLTPTRAALPFPRIHLLLAQRLSSNKP